MAVETVIFDEVVRKNDKWFSVTLVDDDRKLDTNSKTIADQAQELAASGTPVAVEIGYKKNGEYDNYYLNKILGGASEAAPARPVAEPTAPVSASRPRDEVRQETITRQWAFGQALNLFVSEGGTIDALLNDETEAFSRIQTLADMLVTAVRP